MSPSKLLMLIGILMLATPIEAETGWALLGTAQIEEHITETSYRAEKWFPAELRDATRNFEIAGYVVPIEAQPYIRTFLLVQDVADCPFCGDGGYGTVLEIEMRRPIADRREGSAISLRGRLELVSDPETSQMFRLVRAREIPPNG